MYKLVVLSALVALAVAKPSGLFFPSAVSSHSRTDIVHSNPLVYSYNPVVPVVETAHVLEAAPVVPVVHEHAVVPLATSHQYRRDYHQTYYKPVVNYEYSSLW